MNGERTPKCSTGGTARRFVVASAIVAALAAAFLPGAGFGSSRAAARGPQSRIPAGLVAALHSRFGAASVRSASGATEHPQLGFAAALSADGTTALVSAPGAGNQNGAVYVYHVASAGSWVASSTPTATLSGHLFDSLGWGIALSADGTTAFVGTPFGGGGGGAVFVYHVSSEDAWASTSTPTATLTVDNGDFFGLTVAASDDGTTVIAGDPFHNNYAGGARVYHVSSEDAWVSTSTPTATLSNAAEPGSDSEVGSQVAMSGDGTTVLVSDVHSASNTGGAYLFHVASEGTWATSSAPTAILTNASGVAQDLLGVGLALSGDGTTAFVGAPGVQGYRGEVDVFHAAAAPLWVSSSTPAAILTNGVAAKYAFLGALLAVSADGTTVAAGAPGVKRSAGAAYVFHASAEGAWASSATPTAALTDSAGARNDELGASLAIAADGATVLIGAPRVNWLTGKADVFHVADSGSWLTTSTPTAALTNSALPKPMCVVPGLKRYHVRFAREVLAEENCRLGKVKRVHSTKKNRRLVVSQSPKRGRHLPPGSKVNVKIGK